MAKGRTPVLLLLVLVAASGTSGSIAKRGVDEEAGWVTTLYVGSRTVYVLELQPEHYWRQHARDGVPAWDSWNAPVARAYVQSSFGNATWVVVKADAIGKDALIAHEVGHVLGLDHEAAPTVMNPTGLMRWVDPHGLRDVVAEARARGHPGLGAARSAAEVAADSERPVYDTLKRVTEKGLEGRR